MPKSRWPIYLSAVITACLSIAEKIAESKTSETSDMLLVFAIITSFSITGALVVVRYVRSVTAHDKTKLLDDVENTVRQNYASDEPVDWRNDPMYNTVLGNIYHVPKS